MALRIDYNGCDMWKRKATELLNQGGGGTDDYEDLENKPSINGVELSGNKTAAELGMYTKSEVDTSLANKMDLNATSGSISNLNILGNYGIGNVENGGRVYITGWQNKYRNFNFPEIAIGSYDAENDTFSADISMNIGGFFINNLEFDYFGNHGQGSVKTIDVHIGSSDFSIKEGIGNTNIIKVYNTGNIDVNASHVVFDSDNWVSAYAVDGFRFASDDDFEIDAVGIKIASDGITKSRALYVDSNGYLVSSAVTNTELGYLSGVTSAIQTQLNNKQATITGAATTITTSNLTASRALISNSSGKVAVSAVTSTELGYLSGVTSAIQTQLNGKAATSALAIYLPLAGGTMTSWINSKQTFDVTTAPSSTINGFGLRFQDKNATTVSYIRPRMGSSGNLLLRIQNTRTISGTTYDNYIEFGIQNDGTKFMSISDPAAWRSSLGLGSVATLSTVPIANGGTGATSRLAALKALTNENVGTNATYFLTITDSWGKGGYTTVANARSVLGVSNLVIARKKAYNVEQVGHRTAIAADTISGYKFLCWVHCSTNGWVGNCYVQDPVASSTYVWNATYSQTLSGSVYVTALYIRDI